MFDCFIQVAESELPAEKAAGTNPAHG